MSIEVVNECWILQSSRLIISESSACLKQLLFNQRHHHHHHHHHQKRFKIIFIFSIIIIMGDSKDVEIQRLTKLLKNTEEALKQADIDCGA